jgi:hypothetical protein
MGSNVNSDDYTCPKMSFPGEGFVSTCISTCNGSWSPAQLDDPAVAVSYKDRLAIALRNRDITDAFAVSPVHMSGVIVKPEELTTTYEIGLNVRVHRNTAIKSDGVLLPPQGALIFAAGGCPVAVLYGKTLEGKYVCVACHVGRESAIDKYFLGESDRPREHFSVIHAMVAVAKAEGLTSDRMSLRCFFQIPAMCFSHPLTGEHAVRNKKILDLLRKKFPNVEVMPTIKKILCLDMGILIRELAYDAGISIVHIRDCVLPMRGPYKHTRHPTPKLKGIGNLIIVQRT